MRLSPQCSFVRGDPPCSVAVSSRVYASKQASRQSSPEGAGHSSTRLLPSQNDPEPTHRMHTQRACRSTILRVIEIAVTHEKTVSFFEKVSHAAKSTAVTRSSVWRALGLELLLGAPRSKLHGKLRARVKSYDLGSRRYTPHARQARSNPRGGDSRREEIGEARESPKKAAVHRP